MRTVNFTEQPEVTCDLVYFAAGERTGFTKAEPLAHGVKRGVLLSPSPRVRGEKPREEWSSGLCPGEVLGLTSPKPRWQEVVEPPADPPQKGVALLKPTKGEAMLGSK